MQIQSFYVKRLLLTTFVKFHNNCLLFIARKLPTYCRYITLVVIKLSNWLRDVYKENRISSSRNAFVYKQQSTQHREYKNIPTIGHR